MRFLTGALLLVAFLLSGGAVQAGVYSTTIRPIWPLPSSLDQLRPELGELRAVDDRAWEQSPRHPRIAGLAVGLSWPTVSPSTRRSQYLRQLNALQAREQIDALTVLDHVDLSACRIRLGRRDRAIEQLEKLVRQLDDDEPGRFMVLANLAAAYQDIDLPRAIEYQTQALQAWPADWPGWRPEQLAFYCRAEAYQLSLLKARYAENQAARGGRPSAWKTVDPIFPRVQFVGPSGQYEAGTIAPRLRAELPPDAGFLVIQMLFWTPGDVRLYWLLAELSNAVGLIADAHTIMDELVYSRQLSGIQELNSHRQLLKQAISEQEKFQAEAQKVMKENPDLNLMILWLAAPRGGLLSPGLGVAANESAFAGRAKFLALSRKPPENPTPKDAKPPPWLPDWRQILVSFAAGCLVTVLVGLQLREWLRGAQAGPRNNGQTTRPLAEAAAPGEGPEEAES